MGVCDPQPSALILGPRPSTLGTSALGPHHVGPLPPKYSKNKFMNKAYIRDYTYSTLNYYTYSIYSKSYLERSSYGVQINGKAFHHFSLMTKEMEKNFMLKSYWKKTLC